MASLVLAGLSKKDRNYCHIHFVMRNVKVSNIKIQMEKMAGKLNEIRD